METDPTPIRRTKSVVRRALCDILRPVLTGVSILELFAGTGQVSEALIEEGARDSVAVDLREAPDSIHENITWEVRSVRSFLEKKRPGPYEIIFMDPPYQSDRALELLPDLAHSDWLTNDGIVAVETGEDASLPDRVDRQRSLCLMRKRRYGGSRLWIYQEGRDEPGYKD